MVEPPAHAGRTYDLDDELTIGRSPGCGVAMPEDIYTSTLHARLFRRNDQLWVEDLGSTNGTFVNSRADHAGDAPRQGRPAPDRLHRLRGLAVTVLRSGSATDVGRVRTVNQDLPLERPNLYAVADGMGGHVGGEVAARVAVETLERAFERAPTVDGLREAFSEANAAVWHESQVNVDLRGMGTTLTAMALVGGTGGGDVLALANVGDSRAYVFSGGHLVQVTDDHSLAEERMRHGEMTEAEAAVHPQRHILTRALGVSSEVEADMWELELRHRRPGAALLRRAEQRGGDRRDGGDPAHGRRPAGGGGAARRRGQRARGRRQHHRGRRRRAGGGGRAGDASPR